MTYVGTAVPRVEDGPLLTGAGCFVDDLGRGRQLTARMVRSDVASGRLMAVHTDAAQRRPGVAAVITLPHWDEATGNPLHAKAAGEGGIIGSGAAIANAVADAVGDDAGLSRLPLTPSALLAVVGEEPS